MSRPNENRVRRVVHVLPVTDARLQKLAEKHGTLGRAVDAALGVSSAGRAAGAGVKAKRSDSKRKKSNDPSSAMGGSGA